MIRLTDSTSGHLQLLIRKLLCVIALCIVTIASHAQTSSFQLRPEALTYKITYKWGLITKQAGTATITLAKSGDKYYTKLTGRTEPWADSFYMVRDTLNGIMTSDLKPLFYEKIAREDKSYKHDIVRFTYKENDMVIGDCSRKVYKKDKLKKDETRQLESIGKTVDMLSSFFLLRTFPFEEWSDGHKETMTIFSGKRKEVLTFKYNGIKSIKVDKKKFNCYHITFIFTSNDGKKTSENMEAWLTTDNRRIPVKLEGHLPVGKVVCLYTGN